MEQYSDNLVTRVGTPLVSANSKNRGATTSNGSYGQTVKKGLTAQAGLMMSNVEEWLEEERLFGTSAVNILFSVLIVGALIGIFFGIKWERSRNDSFYLNGIKYKMVGLTAAGSDVSGAPPNLYVPIYKETK